jgi:ribosomal protein L5
MPLGAITTVSGTRAYEVLDKMIETVLPRLRDFHGIIPEASQVKTDGGSTVVSVKIPGTFFFEIEFIFERYLY